MKIAVSVHVLRVLLFIARENCNKTYALLLEFVKRNVVDRLEWSERDHPGNDTLAEPHLLEI